MKESTESKPREASAAPAFWESRRGHVLAVVGLLAVCLSLLFGNLSGIGVWEPWEANEIKLAQEYATREAPKPSLDPKAHSWNWAVPTYNLRPVDRPLLGTMILARQVGGSDVKTSDVGELERRARLPSAIAALLMILIGAAWMSRRFGIYRAAITGAVLATFPAMYIGVHNLAAEMFFVVTSTLAILAFFELAYDRSRWRWLWGAVFGVFLALAVFEQRLLGLYLPLVVIATFAATESFLGEAVRKRDGPSAPARYGMVEIGGALAAIAAAVVVIATVVARGTTDEEDVAIAKWAIQLLFIVIPPLLIFAGVWFGRKSKPGRGFFSLPGVLGTAVGVSASVFLARTYADANPILLDGGRLFGDVRVFAYMVGNHVFERSIVDDHMTFDVVMRQVGFSLFPWAALFPAALVYLAHATRVRNVDGKELGASLFEAPEAFRRLCLVWMVAAAVVMGVASHFHHYFYPAYFPIAVGIALALTDVAFWREARRHAFAPYALGFIAVCVILMLGKDLERYPSRFIELYLSLQEDFELPEDFSWGKIYKPLKYTWALFLMTSFFGLVSWAVLTARNARNIPRWIGAIRRRDWGVFALAEQDEAAHVVRAREKEAVREGSSIPSRIARLVETPLGFAPLAVLIFWVSALLFLYSFIPNITNHLSQRGVFETYTRLADEGEELYRFQVTSRDNSVYLQNVAQLKSTTELEKKFGENERFFAVIPRSKLAAINYDIRKKYKENLAVLDARSSRLLLVSNKLEEGEEDHSFVADKIVEGEPQIEYPVEYKTKDGMKHPVFDGQLEFLGYNLNHPKGKGGLARYGWGDEMIITYVFRVLERVPSSQKIFLHVDFPGNRINGDHYPNDGDFPTNYWLPGDIVLDEHHLTIDSYSSPGIYTMHMGFFLGSRRMKVEPREAHDGRDRITIGKIEVTSGL